jgi:hypothetical protein
MARNFPIKSKGLTEQAARARSKAVKPVPMVPNQAPARNLKVLAPSVGNPSAPAVKARS